MRGCRNRRRGWESPEATSRTWPSLNNLGQRHFCGAPAGLSGCRGSAAHVLLRPHSPPPADAAEKRKAAELQHQGNNARRRRRGLQQLCGNIRCYTVLRSPEATPSCTLPLRPGAETSETGDQARAVHGSHFLLSSLRPSTLLPSCTNIVVVGGSGDGDGDGGGGGGGT